MTTQDLKERLRKVLGDDDSRFLRDDLTETLRLSGAHRFEITNIDVCQTHRGVTVMLTWEKGATPEKVVAAIQC